MTHSSLNCPPEGESEAPNGLELSCPAKAGRAPLIVAHDGWRGAPHCPPARRVSFSELLGRPVGAMSADLRDPLLTGDDGIHRYVMSEPGDEGHREQDYCCAKTGEHHGENGVRIDQAGHESSGGDYESYHK